MWKVILKKHFDFVPDDIWNILEKIIKYRICDELPDSFKKDMARLHLKRFDTAKDTARYITHIKFVNISEKDLIESNRSNITKYWGEVYWNLPLKVLLSYREYEWQTIDEKRYVVL